MRRTIRNARISTITLVASILLIPVLTIGQSSDEPVASLASAMFEGTAAAKSSAYLSQGMGEDRTSPGQPVRPLKSLLNADGTLNLKSNFSGSLDARGWKMIPNRNAEPRFVLQDQAGTRSSQIAAMSVPDDVHWDNRFARPGVDSSTTAPTVYALTVSGSNVYVGGEFNNAGGASANHIARWDGMNWSTLADGVDGAVRAIAVSGSDVYVGGDFKNAGGMEANGIAKWNGTSWSTMGTGVTRVCFGCFPGVTAIAVSGNDVYVGGQFISAGGVIVNNIAKWDGTNWSALGNGVEGLGGLVPVVDIAISGNAVYVGGSFGIVNVPGASGVAKWDGTSWSALGTGINQSVSALAVSGSDLYVGGAFDTAGGVSANHIARWNGANWSALGAGVEGEVSALAVSGSNVYAGLEIFTQPSGAHVDRIVKWDGTGWSPLGSGVSSNIDNRTVFVFALAISGTDLYVGGDFVLAGGLVANRFAKWSGSSWSVLSQGTSLPVSALVVNGNDLYAGGDFQAAGGVIADGIAKWDGATWSAIGHGLSGVVNAVAVSGSSIYVGGASILIDGVSANSIARWDGTSWSALGSGLNGVVDAMAVSGSDIYVGGAFTIAGGVSAKGIARWNGANWSALGSGISNCLGFCPPTVRTIAISGNSVYVGGAFATAGGVPASGIARWDGSGWAALGSGVNQAVFAIAVSGSDLYVGGLFTMAGGLPMNHIAKWNGANWSALGAGIDGGVFALAASGIDLYVGGQFKTAGSVAANDIARWNGQEWFALGSGLSLDEFPGYVLAIAVTGCDVYVGGVFSLAGGKPSYCFARWTNWRSDMSHFCLQDDSNPGDVVLIDAQTGDYSFYRDGVPIASGRGTLTTTGSISVVDHTKGNRQIHIQWDTSANSGSGAGTAYVQKLSTHLVCQITDRNMSNNACQCLN